MRDELLKYITMYVCISKATTSFSHGITHAILHLRSTVLLSTLTKISSLMKMIKE